MADFVYIAKDVNGKNKKGVVQAATLREAHSILESGGIYPISLKPARKKISIPKNINISLSTVKSEELIVFTEQFSTLISSGLSILEALSGLAEQTDNRYFKKVILNIKDDIESGASIKTAFEKHRKVFPPIYISLLEVGEQSGTLDKVLKGISTYIERDDEIRKKIGAAFAYPKFVIGVITAVVIFLLTYILPKFVTIYNQANEKLPQPTVIIMSISKFLTHEYLWIIGFTVFIYALYRIIYSTKKGKYYLDKFSLNAPLFGKIRKFSALSRFVHSLSLVLQSGIDIVSAIETAANVTANSFYISELKIVQNEIQSGRSLSEALYLRKSFPRIMAQMASVGEKSGRLDDLLDKLGNLWDRNLDIQIKNMAAKIEPTMIIILGVIVGFIALAMYLPMFGLPGAYRKTL